jgi:hypothetical protein
VRRTTASGRKSDAKGKSMQEKNKLYRRRVLAALGVSALAVGVLAGSANAAAPAENVSSPTASTAEAQAATAYWTPARMAAAKPLDVKPTQRTPAAAVAPETAGPPASVPPAAGSVPPGSAPAPSGPQPLAATMVPRPYTTLPARLNGKLFFTQNGANYVCSGTVVNGTNKDMVDTAGHCVSDGHGHFNSPVANTIFVPAYSSAGTGCVPNCYPYGIWTARTLTTTTEWHVNSNLKQDYGYVVLNTLNGNHIVNLLGGQGTAFNFSRSQTFNAYGYPAAAPFNGYDQKLCVSGRLGDDNPSPSRPGPLTIRINCDMTGGSSGGGWLIGLSGGLGYVNSHNSYRYSNPNDLYGPYYGNEVLSLFNFAQSI